MNICRPAYFDQFRCIASACPDSCCKEWDVQVDPASAALYRSLPGQLGEDLRAVLSDVDDETVMTIIDGRCPMWRPDGLCRIQAELGESALCKTCRDFPRLTHDYGDFRELGLELSCPEAARFLLYAPPAPFLAEETSEEGEAEYDREAMAVLLETRKRALALLSDNRDTGEALALLLLYGCQAQSELDSGEMADFDEEAALETCRAFAKPGDIALLLQLYRDLEILTPQWPLLLENPSPHTAWPRETKALARYLVERYWLQAVSDYDLYSRVKFLLTGCLLLKHLGGDPLRTAQLWSKESENDAENVDALLDAAYNHPALTDDKLLGLLLGR